MKNLTIYFTLFFCALITKDVHTQITGHIELVSVRWDGSFGDGNGSPEIVWKIGGWVHNGASGAWTNYPSPAGYHILKYDPPANTDIAINAKLAEHTITDQVRLCTDNKHYKVRAAFKLEGWESDCPPDQEFNNCIIGLEVDDHYDGTWSGFNYYIDLAGPGVANAGIKTISIGAYSAKFKYWYDIDVEPETSLTAVIAGTNNPAVMTNLCADQDITYSLGHSANFRYARTRWEKYDKTVNAWVLHAQQDGLHSITVSPDARYERYRVKSMFVPGQCFGDWPLGTGSLEWRESDVNVVAPAAPPRDIISSSFTRDCTDQNQMSTFSGTATVSWPGYTANDNFQVGIFSINFATNTSTPVITGVQLTGPNPTHTFTSLAPGNYFFRVTSITPGGNGMCSRDSYSGTLYANGIPVTTLESKKDITCFGADDGEIYAGFDVGAGPVFGIVPSKYGITPNSTGIETFSPGTTGQGFYKFTGLAPDTYTITAYNDLNCSHNSITVIITEPTDVNLTVTAGTIDCFNGLITVTIEPSGGLPNTDANGNAIYYFRIDGNWQTPINPGPNTFPFGAGTYTFKISDGNGCFKEETISITEPTQLSLSLTSMAATSCDDVGMISATASGGTPNYEYKLHASGTFGTNNSFNNLAQGYYDVFVKDNNGCIEKRTIEVEGFSTLANSGGGSFNSTCFGNDDGRITRQVSGGSPPYIVDLVNSGGIVVHNQTNVNPNDQIFITDLPPDTYELIATDMDGCSISFFNTINEPPLRNEIDFHVEYQCDNTCYYFTVANYNYPTFLAPGQQDIEIILADGTIVNNKSALLISSGNNDEAVYEICHWRVGANISPYAFGSTLQGVDFQSISMSSLWDCWTPVVHPLSAADRMSRSNTGYGSIDVVNATCEEHSDGEITICLDNAYTPIPRTISLISSETVGLVLYSQTKIAPETCYTFTGLIPGTYWAELTMADDDGIFYCDSYGYDDGDDDEYDPIYVNYPNIIPIWTQTGPDLTCRNDNGEITVMPQNGLAPYTYSYDGVNFQNSNVLVNISPDQEFWVQDANGCVVLGTVDAEELSYGPSPITATTHNLIEMSDCGPGVDSVHVLGGDGPLTVTVQYAVINGTDITSQIQNNTSYIGENDHFIFSNPFDNSMNAPVGSIGSIDLYIQDTVECDHLITLNFVIPDTLVLDIVSSIGPSCFGVDDGSIEVLADLGTSPYTYTLNNDPVTNVTLNSGVPAIFNGLTNDKYFIQVRDADGCKAFELDSLDIANEITVAASFGAPLQCADDSTGTISFMLSGGAPPYDVQLTANGVLDGDPFSLNENQKHILNDVPSTELQLVITDANGCEHYDAIYHPGPNGFDISLEIETSPNCSDIDDGEITFSMDGGTGTLQSRINGGNLSTDTSYTGLAGGTYFLEIIDDNNCVYDTTIILDIPEPIILTASSTDVLCNGDDDGTITLSATGGTGAITYSIDGANYGPNGSFTGLAPNTYTAYAKDALGCIREHVNVVIGEPPLLVLTEDIIQDADCNGPGIISVMVAGGVPGYTYDWDNGASTNNILYNASAGPHVVEVTDMNGCTKSLTITLTVFDSPLIVEDQIIDEACGQVDGSMDLSGTAGTAPYTFTLGATTNSTGIFGPLAAGTYTVTIEDADGCMNTKDVVIESVAAPTLSILNQTETSCTINDGTVTLTESGGTAPFTYTWSHDAALTGSTATGLAAGTYLATVTDDRACTDNISVTITQIASPDANVSQTNPTYCGMDNGTALIGVVGGQAPYDYTWSHDGNINSQSATNLSAGNYTVTITDQNQCEDIVSFTIVEIDGPSITIATQQDETCDQQNGEIILTNASGTAPFIYTWSHNAAILGNTASNLSAGTYSVTIEDVNGCEDQIIDIVIDNIPGVALAVDNQTQNTCQSGNAVINLSATGGSPTYDYTWSHDANLNAPTASGLMAGTYNVTVEDMTGCTDDLSIIITDGAFFAFDNQEVTQPSCTVDNGSIVLSMIGGVNPYTYTWSHDALLNAPNATGLGAGNYDVTITDQAGCELESSFTLTVPASPSAGFASTNSTCGLDNGTITINAGAGLAPYTYTWSHDPLLTGPLATGLAPGNYSATLTDANDCIDIASIIITGTPAAMTSIASTTDETCGLDNGEINLFALSGASPFAYAWSHDPALTGQTATGLTAGTYSITMTDFNGCTDITEIDIEEIGLPVVNASLQQGNSCDPANGAITIAVTGGTAPFTYDWAHDALLTGPSISSLVGGTYFVTVTDDNDCTTEASYTIQDATLLASSIDNVVQSDCGNTNGSITIATIGGVAPYTYAWSHDPALNSNTATGISGGTYTITITDQLGCMNIITETITDSSPPIINNIITEDASCEDDNGSITVNVISGTPPYTYSWSHYPAATGMTITNIGGGVYTVTVTDTNGCQDIRNITVATTDGPSNYVSSQINPSCGMANGTIILNVSGGTAPYTYQWYLLPDNVNVISTNMILTNAVAGDYFVRITDAIGCKSERITTLYDELIMTLIGSATETTCHDTEDGSASVAVTLGGVAPFTYLWNDPLGQTTATATNLAAGNYSVSVTDATGCIRTRTVNVTSPDPLSYELQNIIEPLCLNDSNGSADIIVSGGVAPYTINWTNGIDSGTNGNMTNIPAGNYTVSIEDANECSQDFEFSIEQPEAIVISEAVNNSSNCNGSAGGTLGVNVNGGTGPFTYLWNDPLGQTTATAYNLDAGSYSVVVTDANGCISDFTTELVPGGGLEIILNSIQTPSCDGNTDGSIDISITSGSGDYSFQWNDDNFQTNEDLQNVDPGIYQIIVTDNVTGCTAEASYLLNLPSEFFIQTMFSSHVFCDETNTGTIEVLVLVGGTAPFTYLWDDPEAQTGVIATNLAPGTYTVTVTDANGCSDTQSLGVSQIGGIEIEEIANNGISCFGASDGSAEILITGVQGTTVVDWPDLGVTGTTISNLEAGDYTVNVTDEIGCEQSYTVSINGSDALTLNPGDIVPPQCDGSIGGSLTVEVNGGTGNYTYLWDDPLGQFGATALDLDPGNYTVLVTDENGCEENITMTIPETNSLEITLAEAISPDCNGDGNGSLEIIVTGGDDNYQYFWNDVAAQTTAIASNLAAGQYIVQVSNGDGTCITNDTFLLEEPELLMIGGIEALSPECAGEENGQLNVDVIGGTGPYMILIDGLGSFIGTSVTDLPSGDYSFSVMDANSCLSNSETFSLTDPDIITISETITQPLCAEDANGSISVTPAGGSGNYTYLWLESGDDASTLENLTSGTYTLEVRDENGCLATMTYDLESTSPEIIISTLEEKLPSCADANNGAIELDIAGGFGNLMIEWSNGASNVSSISGLIPAEYSVTVSDENGCSVVQNYDISNVGDFEIDLLDDGATYCDGITLLLGEEAQADRTYSWAGPNGFTSTESEIAVFETGDYTLTVEEAGCMASETINIVEFEDALQPLFIIPTQVVVNDTVVALEVTWPVPDEVEWIYDDTVIDFVGLVGNQIRFIFPTVGDYTIGLRAKKGECEGAIYKDVSVFPDSSQIVTPIDFGDRQIISALLTPNPNQGIFDLNMELNTQADYSLTIFDINGVEEDTRVGNGISTINEAYNLNLNAGIYVMVIQSKTETRSITFVVE